MCKVKNCANIKNQVKHYAELCAPCIVYLSREFLGYPHPADCTQYSQKVKEELRTNSARYREDFMSSLQCADYNLSKLLSKDYQVNQ